MKIDTIVPVEPTVRLELSVAELRVLRNALGLTNGITLKESLRGKEGDEKVFATLYKGLGDYCRSNGIAAPGG